MRQVYIITALLYITLSACGPNKKDSNNTKKDLRGSEKGKKKSIKTKKDNTPTPNQDKPDKPNLNISSFNNNTKAPIIIKGTDGKLIFDNEPVDEENKNIADFILEDASIEPKNLIPTLELIKFENFKVGFRIFEPAGYKINDERIEFKVYDSNRRVIGGDIEEVWGDGGFTIRLSNPSFKGDSYTIEVKLPYLCRRKGKVRQIGYQCEFFITRPA